MNIVDNLTNEIQSLENVKKIYADNERLFEVIYELNTSCNWKCKHCYIPEHNDNGVELCKIKKVLEDLKKEGVFEIIFTGGEIFCRSDIMDIIEYSRRLGFSVNIFTNASLLNEEMIDQLKKLSISSLSCSIYSMVSEVHDEITQVKGSHALAIKNILLAKKAGLDVVVKCMIMKQNYKYINTLRAFCESNELGFVIDTKIYPRNDGNKCSMECMLDDKDFYDNILEYDDIVGYEVKVKQDTDYVCNKTRNSFAIDCRGNVYPCNRLLKKIGNVYEDNVTNIWNKYKEAKYYRNLTWGELKECRSCNLKDYCIFCPGSALLEEGKLLSKCDSCCKLASIRKDVYCKDKVFD